jgi:hypothetical protein
MTSEDLEPWSVGKRWERRMQLLVLREQLAKKTRDEDVLLESATPEEQERWVDDITSRWAAIHQMYDELDAARGYPDGDSCCVVHDEPVFGMNNAPDIDRLLYHYTPAKNLPKIRSTMSLRFGPLSGITHTSRSKPTPSLPG